MLEVLLHQQDRGHESCLCWFQLLLQVQNERHRKNVCLHCEKLPHCTDKYCYFWIIMTVHNSLNTCRREEGMFLQFHDHLSRCSLCVNCEIKSTLKQVETKKRRWIMKDISMENVFQGILKTSRKLHWNLVQLTSSDWEGVCVPSMTMYMFDCRIYIFHNFNCTCHWIVLMMERLSFRNVQFDACSRASIERDTCNQQLLCKNTLQKNDS